MPEGKRILDVLSTSGNVILEGNQTSVRVLTEQASDLVEAEQEEVSGKTKVWYLPGHPLVAAARVMVLPTGHMVFYGTHGRRILGTDPEGTPLHECEWIYSETGMIQMTRARIQLDSQQWVGIQAKATEQVTTLEVPAHQEAQEPAPDCFRQMAAKAWGVPLDDLCYFYPDESFTRDESGRVRVRLKKDGLYLLEDGTFDHARFVSYMGAIPWARIDLLNVVELFQSALLGTGGAAFDLIWGLCEDQRIAEGPIPLRYRGIPTFPSDQAYGLFCAFFRPEAPDGQDPHTLFMDTQRAYQIAWWPRPDPPWRYFDHARRLCVTVQGEMAQKVTVVDDLVAVPYVNLGMKGFASCERTVSVVDGNLRLRDREEVAEIPLNPMWGITGSTPETARLQSYPFGWRSFFRGALPKVDPIRAWMTALVFPDDESEVGEDSTQLFVLEQIYDYLNQLRGLRSRLERTHWVLIHKFEPVCAGFVDPDNLPRRYTLLYSRPEWAQKNAQAIWDRAARDGRLDAVFEVEFVPEQTIAGTTYGGPYDLIYRWIPFDQYDDLPACEAVVKEVAHATSSGGLAVVAGPPDLVTWFPLNGLHPLCHGGVDDLIRLPAVIEHFRIHPNTRIKPQLTVVMGEKGG